MLHLELTNDHILNVFILFEMRISQGNFMLLGLNLGVEEIEFLILPFVCVSSFFLERSLALPDGLGCSLVAKFEVLCLFHSY